MDSQWLEWAQRLQAIAQTGLAYTPDPYDKERYTQLRQLASEILAAQTGLSSQQFEDLFIQQAGYATPRTIVRGAVFQDDKLLLVKERRDQGWTLPGGFADVGLSPTENVIKEIYEESGYQTRVLKLLAVYYKSRHPHPPSVFQEYTLFFLCELISGQATTSIETDAVGFFTHTQIAQLKLSLPRILPSQIDRIFAHYYHPEWLTDID